MDRLIGQNENTTSHQLNMNQFEQNMAFMWQYVLNNFIPHLIKCKLNKSLFLKKLRFVDVHWSLSAINKPLSTLGVSYTWLSVRYAPRPKTFDQWQYKTTDHVFSAKKQLPKKRLSTAHLKWQCVTQNYCCEATEWCANITAAHHIMYISPFVEYLYYCNWQMKDKIATQYSN
jgi:hypothetical protein